MHPGVRQQGANLFVKRNHLLRGQVHPSSLEPSVLSLRNEWRHLSADLMELGHGDPDGTGGIETGLDAIERIHELDTVQ